jgi:hypothetical protein
MASQVTLYRNCHAPEMGTFGFFELAGKKIYTVERPWKDNLPMVSCIPQGHYVAEIHDSPKFGKTYIVEGNSVARTAQEVHDQPGKIRSHVLFHKGNTMADSRGCILPGLTLGALSGNWAVINSAGAMRHMFDNLPDRWQLSIINL